MITHHCAPYEGKLTETLAVSEGLLNRRGNITGSMDQVILDALVAAKDAEITFSSGLRRGTSILPGDTITLKDVMNQTAIAYPQVTLSELTGEAIKNILEDVCDNLFNPNPYYQQGRDMVRIGGMRYTCNPTLKIGNRISKMMLPGQPIEAGKR